MTVSELRGRIVRLRPLTELDLPRIAEIRRTDEVARRWRGGEDLAAELAKDLADEGLFQFAIDVAGEVVGMIQFSEESWGDGLLMDLLRTDAEPLPARPSSSGIQSA